MGGGDRLSQTPARRKTYTEIFREACPVFMSYGMSAQEFWHGDPWLAVYYKQAYIERRKAENHRDWLLGGYIYQAIMAAMANSVCHKAGTRLAKYTEEPFRIFPMTKAEREAKVKKEREERMAALRAMQNEQRAKKKKAREKRNAESSDT